MGEREELAERLRAIGRTLVAIGSFDDAADCDAAATLLTEGPRLAFRWEGWGLMAGSMKLATVSTVGREGKWCFLAAGEKLGEERYENEAQAKAAAVAHITSQIDKSRSIVTASLSRERALAEALESCTCPNHPAVEVGDCAINSPHDCHLCRALAAYRKRQG